METEALKEACAILPDGASWGDHVTPEMVLAIAEAARGYERERWVTAAAVAVQELAHCAEWTSAGVSCKALRDLLRA